MVPDSVPKIALRLFLLMPAIVNRVIRVATIQIHREVKRGLYPFIINGIKTKNIKATVMIKLIRDLSPCFLPIMRINATNEIKQK
jgi:hypothetical protein